MAREQLHAFVGDVYVGRFERDIQTELPRFVPAEGSGTRLSLSLLLDGSTPRRAPQNFLDGLLPESSAARSRIQKLVDAPSAETWDLLSAVGGDLPGGVILTTDEAGPARGEPLIRVAFEDDIAGRIAQIKAGGTAYDNPNVKPRFSLAGAQGKFAYTAFAGGYYWPDEATPSTHIVKPEAQRHSGLELIESATLELARRAGLATPQASQREFSGETAYVVERFDRVPGPDGMMRRLHMEDSVQALGRAVEDKYQIHTDDIIELLRGENGDEDEGYAFYRQYVFNTLIGNTDAHGKNYSLMLHGNRVSMSPLYDALPVGWFDDYQQTLSMPVGYNDQFRTLTPEDWEEAFTDSTLDPERLRVLVAETGAAIQEHLDATLGAVDHPRVTSDRLAMIHRVIERSRGEIPAPTFDLGSAG